MKRKLLRHSVETRNLMRRIHLLQQYQRRLKLKWHDADVRILELKHMIYEKLEMLK